MRAIFILIVGCLLVGLSYSECSAQSDWLILKKNGRIMQSYYPGSNMQFSTETRSYDAYVTAFKKDSIFLVQYIVRAVPSNLGVYILDTLSRYYFAINYKEIIAFNKTKGNFISGSGEVLYYGGILLTASGLISWVLAKPNTRYYARPELVISAAALSGIGFLMRKARGKEYKIGNKYTLSYISVH